MSKLTLHVPEELVKAAKLEAAAREVSVSKLVTDFFRNLVDEDEQGSSKSVKLAPRTRNLAGCIPEVEMEEYIDYLEKKHS